jgi:hypothetical protein
MSEGKWTPGPWFVSGVRFRMNGGDWHSVNRYDDAAKKDENIACVGYDSRTGAGRADARLIAAAPDLAEALEMLLAANDDYFTDDQEIEFDDPISDAADAARAALAKAKGETP